MKIVLEGDSLASVVEQAQKLVDEYAGGGEAAPEAAADASAPKRGRGRPAKAAAEIPGHMTKMMEAQKAANAKPAVTKEVFLAAATKLIEIKGEEFAGVLLTKNYMPHARFSEIPQSRWAELVAEVEFILSQKDEPPPVPEKKSLI